MRRTSNRYRVAWKLNQGSNSARDREREGIARYAKDGLSALRVSACSLTMDQPAILPDRIHPNIISQPESHGQKAQPHKPRQDATEGHLSQASRENKRTHRGNFCVELSCLRGMYCLGGDAGMYCLGGDALIACWLLHWETVMQGSIKFCIKYLGKLNLSSGCLVPALPSLDVARSECTITVLHTFHEGLVGESSCRCCSWVG